MLPSEVGLGGETLHGRGGANGREEGATSPRWVPHTLTGKAGWIFPGGHGASQIGVYEFGGLRELVSP